MAEEAILLSNVLQCLVECSQKAAKIAQIFRDEKDLFQLLVEEKSQIEKANRYFQDFKTLADVLVQETIKKDVGEQFPSLLSNIRGEEQNSFQNSLGECVRVELNARPEDTVALLKNVLDGREHVARSLAEVVHSRNKPCQKELLSTTTIPANTVGIWIDPIDSTAEYIKAKSEVETEDHGITPCGLRCVCVLIGAYDLGSGRPLFGVVNQPFYKRDPISAKWESRCYWSVNYNSECVTSLTLLSDDQREEKLVLISSFENQELLDIINSKYRTFLTAGAGHKSLLVACNMADLYILSFGTTYFWDTCAPHALLAAQGGGILKFDDLFNGEVVRNAKDLESKQLKYKVEGNAETTESFRNAGGLIAYRSPDVVLNLLQLLYDRDFKI